MQSHTSPFLGLLASVGFHVHPHWGSLRVKAWRQAYSHWLHLFHISLLCIFTCVFRWLLLDVAYSHWKHSKGFSSHALSNDLQERVVTLVTLEGILSSVSPQMLLLIRSFLRGIVALVAFLPKVIHGSFSSEDDLLLKWFPPNTESCSIALFLLASVTSLLLFCWCLTDEICLVIYRKSESDEDNSEKQSPGLSKN